MHEISLNGKKALVVGAGRGIGRAVALGFARAGADVAVVARSVAELSRVEEEVKEAGANSISIPCDVTDVLRMRNAVSEVVARFGKVDILANIAGISIVSPATEVTEEDWDRVMDVNVRGAFFTAQAVGRHMIENGIKGSIINCTSECQDLAEKEMGAYCPSKGALKMVTQALAAEWGRFGIRVNNLAPSFINTKINEKLINGATEGTKDFFKNKMRRVPLARYGEPDDVVAAAVFLACDAASYVTGSTLLVDGGYTCC